MILDATQIADVFKFAKKKSRNDWDYAMLATSAHTGARRSQLLRLTRQDVDLNNRVVTITEQKRIKGMASTRRVPISDTLAEVLAPLEHFQICCSVPAVRDVFQALLW